MDVVVECLEGAVEDLRALIGRGPRPLGLRLGGGVDRRLCIAGGRVSDLANRFADRRSSTTRVPLRTSRHSPPINSCFGAARIARLSVSARAEASAIRDAASCSILGCAPLRHVFVQAHDSDVRR